MINNDKHMACTQLWWFALEVVPFRLLCKTSSAAVPLEKRSGGSASVGTDGVQNCRSDMPQRSDSLFIVQGAPAVETGTSKAQRRLGGLGGS